MIAKSLCNILNYLYFQVVHIKHDTGNYKMSFWQAYEACQAKGWALTTPEELKSLHKDGFIVV